MTKEQAALVLSDYKKAIDKASALGQILAKTGSSIAHEKWAIALDNLEYLESELIEKLTTNVNVLQ